MTGYEIGTGREGLANQMITSTASKASAVKKPPEYTLPDLLEADQPELGIKGILPDLPEADQDILNTFIRAIALVGGVSILLLTISLVAKSYMEYKNRESNDKRSFSDILGKNIKEAPKSVTKGLEEAYAQLGQLWDKDPNNPVEENGSGPNQAPLANNEEQADVVTPGRLDDGNDAESNVVAGGDQNHGSASNQENAEANYEDNHSDVPLRGQHDNVNDGEENGLGSTTPSTTHVNLEPSLNSDVDDADAVDLTIIERLATSVYKVLSNKILAPNDVGGIDDADPVHLTPIEQLAIGVSNYPVIKALSNKISKQNKQHSKCDESSEDGEDENAAGASTSSAMPQGREQDDECFAAGTHVPLVSTASLGSDDSREPLNSMEKINVQSQVKSDSKTCGK